MSLSTLLEAAKYLDYLDSNNHQNQQQQQQLLFQPSQPTNAKKLNRRSRFSKKNAANTMLAMSLPVSSEPMQVQGVPIPLNSGGESHQATSLSSSFTTGSPLSSFASTALFCSKASGVTSASSSAASSLSSSDSSSSCGEILMGDNDFNQSIGKSPVVKSTKKLHRNNNHHNYHLTDQQQQQQIETSQHQFTDQKPTRKFIASNSGNNNINQSIARYIAATSSGPQLVTMTTTSSIASTSAPVDGNIRAGHVIHAANAAGTLINASPGTSFDPRHAFSLATSPGIHHHHHTLGHCSEGQTFNVARAGSFSSENQLNSSATSCPPLIMARVQPMILNSISPSSHHSIMAFQPATASSPTSSSSSYSRHRELHKTLEKNRRAHLRHCFELLKAELPASECVDKKTSHINIIRSAIGYVLTLRQQEIEIDNELQRLTKIKNELTENLSKLHITEPMQHGQTTSSSMNETNQQEFLNVTNQGDHKKAEPNSPAPEQQLSFLLSQSKID